MRELAQLGEIELESRQTRLHGAVDVRAHGFLPAVRGNEHAEHLERARAHVQLVIVRQRQATIEARQEFAQVWVHLASARRSRRRERGEQHLANVTLGAVIEREEHDVEEWFDVYALFVVEIFQPRVHGVHHAFLNALHLLARKRLKQTRQHLLVNVRVFERQTEVFGELSERERRGASHGRVRVAETTDDARHDGFSVRADALCAPLRDDAEHGNGGVTHALVRLVVDVRRRERENGR